MVQSRINQTNRAEAVSSAESEDIMIYTATWHRYPHGIEGEEMTSCSRDFDCFVNALNFLTKRVEIIKGINWAGGYIEDENGKWLYNITDSGEHIDYRE
jgi:hypothetical protein